MKILGNIKNLTFKYFRVPQQFNVTILWIINIFGEFLLEFWKISIFQCINISDYKYSMIIWNCQKVIYSNSAPKPLPGLPNVSEVAYVWDILIFQAFGTSRSTGKYQDAYLWLETIEENWRKCTKIDPLRISFDTLTPQLYLRTLPNTLTYLKWFPMSPRNAPDHSYTLVRQLESQRVWISIKILQCWPMFSSCKYAPWDAPVYLEVPNALNIKMSHTYTTFGTLGSLGIGFSAEL